MRTQIAVTLVVSFALLSNSTIAIAAAPEEKIPAAACLVISLDKPGEAVEKWNKTGPGEMLAGKEFEPFLAELRKGEVAAPLYPKPALGVDWEDLAAFKSPVGLALLADAEKQPAVALVADATDAAAVKQCLVNAEKYFAGRKVKRTVERITGGEQIVYDIPAAVGAKKGSICVHVTTEKLFLATNSRSAAAAFLKVIDAKTSLAGDAGYQKIAQAAAKVQGAAAGDVRWFVRPLELAELLFPLMPKKERGNKDWVAIARKEGVDSVKGAAGSVTLGPGKTLDLELSGAIVAERPFAKGMRLLDLKAGPGVVPPAWVEAEVSSFVSWNWDFAVALEGIGNWVDQWADDQGYFKEVLDGLKAGVEEGAKVDVRRDIVPRLGPKMFAITDARRAKDKSNPHGLRNLIGMDGKDQPKLFAALKEVTRLDEPPIKQEKVEGADFRYAPEGDSLFNEQDPMDLPNTRLLQALAVTKAHALFSTDAKWLKAKLPAAAKAAKPLTEDGKYSQLASWTREKETKETCLRAWWRTDESWSVDYDTVRGGKVDAKSPLRTQLLRFALLGTSPAAPKGPAAALPKFDTLTPHLQPSAAILSVSPEGFDIRAAMLVREK